MMEISNEFLSKVLGFEVVRQGESNGKIIAMDSNGFGFSTYSEDIYRLVHKNIKQWLKDNGYEICVFDWSDEPEAIVKDVEDMLAQEKADIEFEKENGGVE